MSKNAKPFTLDAELVLERETKNFVVYAPKDGTEASGVMPIYVAKAKLGNGAPNGFMLTLTSRSA